MLRLSDGSLADLLCAQRVLLTPLGYPSDEAWCRAALRAVKRYLGIDLGMFMFAPGTRPVFVTEDFDPALFEKLAPRDVAPGYVVIEDEGVNTALRASASDAVLAFDAHAYFREATGRRFEDSRTYQEFAKPTGVIEPFAVNAPLSSGQALMALGHTRACRPSFPLGERVALAAFLAPALESAANTLAVVGRSASRLCALFDEIGIPAMLISLSGRELARTASLQQLFDEETHAPIVREAMIALAQQLALSLELRRAKWVQRPAQCMTTVVTRAQGYSLRATIIDDGLVGREPAICVTAQSNLSRLPRPESLVARGLTLREAEVAVLLARGASNKQVAARLGLSPSTVRTHAENLFRKLDIHTRKGLALRLVEPPRT